MTRSRHAVAWVSLAAVFALTAAATADDFKDTFDPSDIVAPGATDAGGTVIITDDKPLEARPKRTEADQKLIDRMVDYYLDMYGKHLESPDWVSRCMAVIGLGRIDEPKLTDKLVTVLTEDSKTIVRVFAWEALHARNGSLNDEQRAKWLAGGQHLIAKNALRGDLRVGVLGLMRSAGGGGENAQRFMDLFKSTNSMDPNDIRTLMAMGETLAAWRHPEIIKALIGRMSDLDDAYRAEFVLGGLRSGVPAGASLQAKGSKVMWEETQKAWVEWFRTANPQAVEADKLRPYTGRSRLFPAPKPILDPHSTDWRKDLELGKLHLDQLDVTLVVDSTGSMGQVVQWVQRDTMKLMRAFGIISREPRIGVTFYRDHGDEYVVKMTPMTDKADQLAKAISGVTAKGGGDVPEAVYDGLMSAVMRQQWSGGDSASRVVVLIGDAAPHEKDMEKIQKLVETAVGRGFTFYCVKARTAYGSGDLTSFDKIAGWGKGKSIELSFGDRASYQVGPAGIARPRDEDDPYYAIVREVVKGILSEGYEDRAETFVNVLMNYVDEPVPEKRTAFPPAPPPRPPERREPGERHPPERRDPPPPQKPFDPQER